MNKIIAFCCLLLATTTLAQDDVAVDDADVNGGDVPAPTQADTPTPDAAAATEPLVQQETANKNPYDYRASEQISEDSSVSFPVDI